MWIWPDFLRLSLVEICVDTGPLPFGLQSVSQVNRREEKEDRDQIAMRESRMQADNDRTGQNKTGRENWTRTRTRTRLF